MDRPRFSEMLAMRRRQIGFSIRQASRVLRLREDVLYAFEEGDFEQIPKSGYAQGMLSSYARYLGLDANEVVNAYLEDQDRYNRTVRRDRREDPAHMARGFAANQYGERVGQPYVRSRGLLPTSGGKAGDLGSFSTTRVRPRYSAYEEDEEIEDTGYVPSGYETYDSFDTYPQGRPYTGYDPRGGLGSTGDIRTIGYQEFDYEDDLRPARNDARRYESASSGAGRRSSRHIGDRQRPQVSRRGDARRSRSQSVSRPRRGQGRNSRNSRGRSGRSASRRRQPMVANLPVLAIALGVVCLISVVIVLSVSSCVSQGMDAHTVPVSAATDQTQTTTTPAPATSTSSATSTSQGAQATQTDASATTSTSTSSKTAETSVSVSVAEGAVTWLEVECDGKSDLAETVTGPWQRTYTVEDAITVQAGDTTAVSVVQDGRQVQFDSMASGIGTVRIQGTKKPKTTSTSTSKKTSSTTAKMGNSRAEDEDTTDGYGDDSDSSEDDSSDYGYDEDS